LIKNFRDSLSAKPTIRPYIKWAAQKGDLVKVITTNSAGQLEYNYGIIMGPVKTDQESMFPFVSVYVFDLAMVQNHYPHSLEIISS